MAYVVKWQDCVCACVCVCCSFCIDTNLIHLYVDVYIFSSKFFSGIRCYRVLNRIPVLHSGSWWSLFLIILASLCWTESVHYSLSQFFVLFCFVLILSGDHWFFSESVRLFLFGKEDDLYPFLDPSYKWYLMLILSSNLHSICPTLRSLSSLKFIFVYGLRDILVSFSFSLLMHVHALLHSGFHLFSFPATEVECSLFFMASVRFNLRRVLESHHSEWWYEVILNTLPWYLAMLATFHVIFFYCVS